tara:strand:- start:1120 stop:1554 length:435 start_codon:yes stop_codon:yes gene_type:complete
MSVLSLYIPVISEYTNEKFIIKMFEEHKIGKVMRVDLVFNKSKNRKEAFIHFDEWYNTEESISLKSDIENPNTKTRLVYMKSGKYWPLLINKNAHSRVNNPDYEMLKTSDIKTVYAKSIDKFDKKDVSVMLLTRQNSHKKAKSE